jgi:hypothetical protein
LQTELEDVRTLLEAVSIKNVRAASHSLLTDATSMTRVVHRESSAYRTRTRSAAVYQPTGPSNIQTYGDNPAYFLVQCSAKSLVQLAYVMFQRKPCVELLR